jgi:cytochrome c-type biogenesis protein CcmH/NrfG
MNNQIASDVACERQPETSRLWSNAQAYGLSIVCLALGLAVGFWSHGSGHSGNSLAQATSQQDAATARMPVTPEQMKHMADKTVQPFLDKLKQNPNDPNLLHQVGNAYFAAHQFGTAIEYYSQSADLKPDPIVLTQLSNAYHYSGSDDKALATLDRALQIDPTFANALFNLGMLKWQSQGDTSAAIKAWKQLLKTNPNHPNRRQVEQMIARVKESARQ